MSAFVAFVAALAPGRAAIPAEAPIGGPLWTWVVPTLLFLVALGATWRLYRRFAGEGAGDGRDPP